MIAQCAVFVIILCTCVSTILPAQLVLEKPKLSAEDVLLVALDINPDDLNALYNLGQLYLNENQPEEARTYLDRALKLDDGNPDILVARARVHMLHPDHLDIHGLRTGAHKYLRKAVTIDLSHKPACYYLALASMYARLDRRDLKRAQRLLQQVADADADFKDVHFYNASVQNFDQPKPEDAKAFRDILRRNPDHAAAGIRLAETLFYTPELTDTDTLALACKYYTDGLENLSDPFELLRVTKDFGILLNKKQEQELHTLEPAKRGAWLVRYWRTQDPTPGTELNERLVEHYRRMQYAYEAFPTLNGNDRFDDRGWTYIKYGEPDERFIGNGLGHINSKGLTGGQVYENESWTYFSIDRYLYFDFVDKGGFTYFPSLDHALMAGSDIPYQTLYEDRQVLGYIYRKIAREGEFYLMNFDVQRDNFIEEKPSIYVYDYDGSKPLDFIYDTGLFRAPEDFTHLELYYGAPLKDFKFSPDNRGTHEEPMEMCVTFMDEDYLVIETFSQTFEIPKPKDDARKDQYFVAQGDYDLTPGRYNIAVSLRAAESGLWGLYRDSLLVPDYREPVELAVSSIQMSPEVKWPENIAESMYKGGYEVAPHPSLVFLRNDPTVVFYEIYNLTFGPDGLTDYEVTLTVEPLKQGSVLSSIGRLFGGGKEEPTISFTETGSSTMRTDRRATTLDLSRLKTGDRRLMITIRDNISGQTAGVVKEFIIDKPED